MAEAVTLRSEMFRETPPERYSTADFQLPIGGSIMTKRPKALAVLGILVLSLALAACSTTRQTRSVETSGFLGDYSQFEEGEGDQAQLVYINPNAKFSAYDGIMIDSVTLWHDSETSELSEEDQQMLTDFFYQSLHEALGKDFQVVDSPGPRVMRLRAALTEAKGARVVMNSVTSIVPQFRLLSSLLGRATDTAPWVGKATAEVEITDSMTGTRLVAGVDQRTGTKAVRGGLKTWSHVKAVCDYWSERIATRLQELRTQS
jgi:hypothetical protein